MLKKVKGSLFVAIAISMSFGSISLASTSSSESPGGSLCVHLLCKKGSTKICKSRACTTSGCTDLVDECKTLGKGETANCETA